MTAHKINASDVSSDSVLRRLFAMHSLWAHLLLSYLGHTSRLRGGTQSLPFSGEHANFEFHFFSDGSLLHDVVSCALNCTWFSQWIACSKSMNEWIACQDVMSAPRIVHSSLCRPLATRRRHGVLVGHPEPTIVEALFCYRWQSNSWANKHKISFQKIRNLKLGN